MPYIFLIDDDEDDLEVLESSLKGHGIRIKTFTSGHLAMSYFNDREELTEMPSLIIIDYNMPLINGLETLRLIKKSKERVRKIPAIIYTTTLSSSLNKKAMESGAHGCECKAADLSEFTKQAARFADLARTLLSKK